MIAIGRQRGFTLMELVIGLVVIGASLAGVLMVFQTAVRSSTDPLIAQQLVAIAQSMSEEVMLQPFNAQANTTTSTGCSRASFNDIDDFHGYATTNQICAPDGSALGALAGYSVAVAISPAVVSGTAMKQITITSSRGGDNFVIRAYRADLS